VISLLRYGTAAVVPGPTGRSSTGVEFPPPNVSRSSNSIAPESDSSATTELLAATDATGMGTDATTAGSVAK
jgi:hypothetical protein